MSTNRHKLNPSQLPVTADPLHSAAQDESTGMPAAWAMPQPMPQDIAVASNDAFTLAENTTAGAGKSLFADNGSGADMGAGLDVTAVNGASASVGQEITLASGAHLTVNADGTFDYDPNHAFDDLAAASSGATDTSATDSFAYTIAGGSTATVTLTIDGIDSNDTLIVAPNPPNSMNSIDGGTGTDTAVFSGNFHDYGFGVLPSNGYLYVGANGGTNDSAFLTNVEFERFADGTAQIQYSRYIDVISFTHLDGSNDTQIINHDANAIWGTWQVHHDAAGNLTADTTFFFNESWVNSYDPTNAQPWLWKTDHFDANDHLVETTTTMDDGTHTLTVNDVNNQHGWSSFTLTYDYYWNVTGVSATRDDGSHTISQGEIAAALDDTLWFTTPYDHSNSGPASAVALSGGPDGDVLYGSRAGDTLSGGGGNDLIVGGQGNDTLTGGAGVDNFVFHNGDGQDTITDFTHGQDIIDLHGYDISMFRALAALMTQSGADTVITFDPADTITLHNVTAATLTAQDFVLG